MLLELRDDVALKIFFHQNGMPTRGLVLVRCACGCDLTVESGALFGVEPECIRDARPCVRFVRSWLSTTSWTRAWRHAPRYDEGVVRGATRGQNFPLNVPNNSSG